MDFIKTTISEGIATVALERGKVNALNGQVVEELRESLAGLETSPEVKAVLLTGRGKFFSFGFDIPEFLPFAKQDFKDYLIRFTGLYTYMFLYPKPIVAALNGHAVAGGCMLALACDKRIMVTGGAKISLNEIGFGSSVFSGSTEMLRFWIGNRYATDVLYSGAMYAAEEAKAFGLIDETTTGADLMPAASKTALELGQKSAAAFRELKFLLRRSVEEEMRLNERGSINRFVEIWYSDETRRHLKNIRIY